MVPHSALHTLGTLFVRLCAYISTLTYCRLSNTLDSEGCVTNGRRRRGIDKLLGLGAPKLQGIRVKSGTKPVTLTMPALTLSSPRRHEWGRHLDER